MQDKTNRQIKEELSNIFTKEKIRLMKALYSENVFSIGDLAKYLERDISAVYRDLKMLKKHNLVVLEKDGRKVHPKLKNKEITISFEKPKENSNKEDTLEYIG